MTQLTSLIPMQSSNFHIPILHFLCSSPSISKSLGLLGYILLNFSTQCWLCKPQTSMVLLTNFFYQAIITENARLSPRLRGEKKKIKTVNAGD